MAILGCRSWICKHTHWRVQQSLWSQNFLNFVIFKRKLLKLISCRDMLSLNNQFRGMLHALKNRIQQITALDWLYNLTTLTGGDLKNGSKKFSCCRFYCTSEKCLHYITAGKTALFIVFLNTQTAHNNNRMHDLKDWPLMFKRRRYVCKTSQLRTHVNKATHFRQCRASMRHVNIDSTLLWHM